jgi:hypothetical protein
MFGPAPILADFFYQCVLRHQSRRVKERMWNKDRKQMGRRKTYKGENCRIAEIYSKKTQSGVEGDTWNIYILM